MAERSNKVVPEHRLTVKEVLGSLVNDGLADRTEADALIAESRLKRMGTHPLVVVAERKWKSLKEPFELLTLEVLSEWFAGKVGLEYFNIDPLKVDFTAVTNIVSSAYATRFNILAVQVTPDEVVFATAEPFLREWEKEIRAIAKRRVRRVIANPLDIARYQVEFYNLARSVKKAAQAGGQSAGPSSFEQLVELGRTNRQFDANDRHIV
ncbi:MAG: type II/IV secretion system protein, partial [Candidatus Accumulibacter sp.]|nr:type II/IV secretion system protein [Accumulibacter sp.]